MKSNRNLFAATALLLSLVACGGSKSSEAPASPATNKAPVIKSVVLDGVSNPLRSPIYSPSTVQLIAKAEDPEFHGVDFNLTDCPLWLKVKGTGPGYWELTPDPIKGQDRGSVGREGNLTVTVTDPEGNTTSKTISVHVPNRHVTLTSNKDLATLMGIGDTVRPEKVFYLPTPAQMAKYVNDPEGSELTYSWSAKSGKVVTTDKDGKALVDPYYVAPRDGEDVLIVKIVDILGQDINYPVPVKIAPNAAPVFDSYAPVVEKSRLEANRDAAGLLNFLGETSLGIRVKATDPEKDEVTLKVELDNQDFDVVSTEEKDKDGKLTGYMIYTIKPKVALKGKAVVEVKITATDNFSIPQSTTKTLIMTWIKAPEFTKNLEAQTVLDGEVALEVKNTYDNESTYQWFYLVKGSDTPIKVTGGITPTITVKASQATDEIGKRYFCEVRIKDKGILKSNTTTIVDKKN